MASGAQAGAANNATNLSKEQFEYQKQNALPYQQAGVAALGQMQDPSFQHNFSAADFTASPGYQFSLKQGQDAINAANAASGNSVSGAGLAALSNYNVGAADQEYQQAFNNYQTEQNAKFGRLSTLASGGAGANAAMGGAAQAYAGQAGGNMIGAGNAQGAGMMAGVNALQKGISGVAGALGGGSGGNLMNTNYGYTTPSQNGATLAGGPMDAGGMSASNFALG
jgi:hypothetical protein